VSARRERGSGHLLDRRKNHPTKLMIAARLRKETTLPLKAIADRLHLGTSKNANMNLYNDMRQGPVYGSAQVELSI